MVKEEIEMELLNTDEGFYQMNVQFDQNLKCYVNQLNWKSQILISSILIGAFGYNMV